MFLAAMETKNTITAVESFAWWTFRFVLFLSARGRGMGCPRCQEGGGVRLFIENPRRGGLPGEEGGGRGREGVCGEFGGGGG